MFRFITISAHGPNQLFLHLADPEVFSLAWAESTVYVTKMTIIFSLESGVHGPNYVRYF